MNKPKDSNRRNTNLVRQLGLFDSTMILMGIVIGSGIFLMTGIMAKSLPSGGLLLLAWIVGGLVTLTGALVYAELGAAMPEAGGQYVYLREAYTPLVAFLNGWVIFLVYMCGGIALLGVAFSEYFGSFFPLLSTTTYLISTDLFSVSTGQVVAVVLIILLSIVNYIGVVFGKMVQNILTVIKTGAILLLIIFGLLVDKGVPIDLSFAASGISFSQLVVGFGVAMVAVFWAFDGWNNVNFVAGEIKNPARNLPLAIIGGTALVGLIYVMVNVVYLKALPISEMAGVVTIADSRCLVFRHDWTGSTGLHIVALRENFDAVQLVMCGKAAYTSRQSTSRLKGYRQDFFICGGIRVVKLVVRDRESIQEAVRRFRKLVERSGVKKEMRRREFYEKPSAVKRRAKLRAERRARRVVTK